MLRSVQDHYLPPDHHAFVEKEPATGRIIIIAPTRAACETIEIGLTLNIETYLEKTNGPRLRELARSGKGFGIVAGTGTGKTLAVRPIAEEILKAPLRIGVVNREREATPELPNLNTIVVTTGIARRWFQDGDILPHDTLVVDEIHQTSAELELCLALGKRVGCRFIWLSATVDPTFYRKYLNSADVLEVYSFDPKKAATVKVVNREPHLFLDDDFIARITKQKRGVGMFLPTRAGVEQVALDVRRRFPKLNVAYYHGGEPVGVIRPFLDDEGSEKPYLLTMTAAGQSALNVRGLDTVIIDDTRFSNVIEKGKNVLTRLHLGSNEMLQMAGRVHGRVEGGRVFILSNRDIDFARLKPTAPEFQLSGDSERVALTCADLGVRADELDLPVPLDRRSYREALANLEGRGIINERGRLSTYGKAVEALPVDRAWAELIVNADSDLVPYIAIMSSIESLHRMTRDERHIEDLIVSGSDHLTTYNLYAEAFQQAGFIGEIYGLPRHFFDAETIAPWAQRRGVLVKSLEDAALAMACVLRAVQLPLPTRMPLADASIRRRFAELLAKFMPFDLVIDEQTSTGQNARVSKSSVCGRWGAIAGELRYFADSFGVPRAGIDGTQIPFELIHKYAKREAGELDYNAQRKPTPLAIRSRLEYFGFDLERETIPLEKFPPELAGQARHVLAEALACSEARHGAVHRNRAIIEEIREVYRRSGGQTRSLSYADLTALYEAQLNEQEVNSLHEFREARLVIDLNDFVSPEHYENLLSLPPTAIVRKREVEIDYDVEEHQTSEGGLKVVGVARLRLPDKLARNLTESELPRLDRPLRFIATRGQRGAVRADTLAELQKLLVREDEPEQAAPSPQKPSPKPLTRAKGHPTPRRGRPPGNRGKGGRRR